MVVSKSRVRQVSIAFTSVGLGLTLGGCGTGEPASSSETIATAGERIGGGAAVSCDAWGHAVVGNTSGVVLGAQSLVDSYSSGAGAYGGSNVGSNAIVRAATSITNNGGVVRGELITNAPAGYAVIPVPSNAVKLPLGASSPGSLNINDARSSITLAPGDYVAANINVNSPGAINIAPAGQVRIWVTGTLNLGGKENLNGVPRNLTFLVTSSGFVNVNSGGALYGMIYAPTSTINLNSAVFGSVIGGAISRLNSGAAVHYDTAAACPPPPTTVTTPVALPPPPDVRGCYVGTWNGWVSVPCMAEKQLPPGIAQKLYIGGGQVTIPNYLDGAQTSYGPIPGISSPSGLRFGQVETTFVDVAATAPTEVTAPSHAAFPKSCNYPNPDYTITPEQTPNSLSIQANTNNFVATTGEAQAHGDQAWVQFSLQSRGATATYTFSNNTIAKATPGFVICIWNNDFTLGKADLDDIPNPTAKSCTSSKDCDPQFDCVPVPGGTGNQCLAPTYWSDCLASDAYAIEPAGGQFKLGVQGREFQALDHASVAGSAFDDANDGAHDLGMVAALSWFDPNGNGKDYRGLFAVVAHDRYGLADNNNWTTITGTALGLGNCEMATFSQGTMMYTSVQAGNCAVEGTPPPGVPATVSWPGVCPNTLTLASSPAPGASVDSITDESSNLNIVTNSQSALANATDSNKYLELHYLASVDGQCVGTPRVYVKDHAQDHGSTPSNLGGEAFWESPDIIIVPPNTPVTPDTPPGDPLVIAGQNYDLYVRLHNEFACSSVPGVRARLWWGDATLANAQWTDIITGTPDAGFPHWSAAKTLMLGDSLDIIGPISWTAPSNVSPHQCLLANIQAIGEAAPANISDAPNSYQVAQRNIEIGGECSWLLANGAQASQLGVVLTATDAQSQSYLLGPGDIATATFDDPAGTLYNNWSTNPHPGCTLNQNDSKTKTIVTMSTGVGQASVQGAPIAASATLNVTSEVIPALFSGKTINLGIGTYISNGGTLTKTTNGATCSGHAEKGEPPVQ